MVFLEMISNDLPERCSNTCTGSKHSTVEDFFAQEDIVSGVIDKKRHPLVCFEESQARGIGVHPLIFNDNKGSWKCNLWYSEKSTQINHLNVYKNREELLQDCTDFFILLRDKDTTSTLLRTMACHSWRVRDDGGNIWLLFHLRMPCL